MTYKQKLRIYGVSPCKLAVIHGGPGDIGSLGYLAERLGHNCSVLEPFQSAYDIDGLIPELKQQLKEYADLPVVLLGHSWGAWLAVIFTVYNPAYVKSLILVGTPPLDPCYVKRIMENRIRHLSPDEADRLVENLNSGFLANIDEIKNLIYKSDNYEPLAESLLRPYQVEIDWKMNQSIWKEAETLRENGTLKSLFHRLECPLHIIHGEYDPHPVDGVLKPLKKIGINFKEYILPRCGHSPFYEKEWGEWFDNTVLDILTE